MRRFTSAFTACTTAPESSRGFAPTRRRKGTAIFRLSDHLQRLHDSARMIRMQIPYSVDELREAALELVAANGLPSCYVRPIAFYGYGSLGVPPRENPVYVAIMCWPWGAYLGEEGLTRGIRAKISTWVRMPSNVIPHAAKATGLYLNSMLAVQEAALAGYEEAILLTEKGYVADCSGENVFIVKDGVIYTPSLETGILHGITRDSVMQIAALARLRSEDREPDPRRPLRRRRGVHDRHRRRGDAGARGRRLPDRRSGPGDARSPARLSRIVQGRDERWAHWLEHVTPVRAEA